MLVEIHPLLFCEGERCVSGWGDNYRERKQLVTYLKVLLLNATVQCQLFLVYLQMTADIFLTELPSKSLYPNLTLSHIQ